MAGCSERYLVGIIVVARIKKLLNECSMSY